MTIRFQVPPKVAVQSSGTPLSSDIDTFNFAGGLATTVDGYGKATISSFGGGGAYIKAGIVAAGAFSGNPKKATVTFSSAFPSANYTITILGTADGRGWTYESKAAGSFVINTNASAALSGEVSWQAIIVGEFS